MHSHMENVSENTGDGLAEDQVERLLLEGVTNRTPGEWMRKSQAAEDNRKGWEEAEENTRADLSTKKDGRIGDGGARSCPGRAGQVRDS